MSKLYPLLPLLAAGVAAAAPAKRPVAPPVVPSPSAPVAPSNPLDVLGLEREHRAGLSYTDLQDGSADAIFDGNMHTAVRTVPLGNGMAGFQVRLDRPRVLDAVDVTFAGDACGWTLYGADSEADMKARGGTFTVLVPLRTATEDRTETVNLPTRRAFRVYRLEARRANGEGAVALADWALWSPQQLSRIEVEPFVPNVAIGSLLQLRALGVFDGGARQNLTTSVAWSVSPSAAGTVDDLQRLVGRRAGTAEVSAAYRGVRSAAVPIDVMAQARPDWDVTYIERTPHARPRVGQSVTWFAHVKNYGTGEAQPVPVEVRVDGRTILTSELPRMERFAQTEVMFTTKWDGDHHTIECVVDPHNRVTEASKENNRLSIATDARAAAFWVEEGALGYFHRHQRELGVGSNSWEDWAQRQIAYWNEQGGRWRLDRIVLVRDGVLPLAGGSAHADPDRRDRDADLAWGFPAADLTRGTQYRRTFSRAEDNAFYIDRALLRNATRRAQSDGDGVSVRAGR